MHAKHVTLLLVVAVLAILLLRSSDHSIAEQLFEEPVVKQDNFGDFLLKNTTFSGEEMFIHKVFYDQRDPKGNTIRILANIKCQKLKASDVYVQISDGLKLPMQKITLVDSSGCSNECHFKFATIDSIYFNETVGDTVTVWRKNMRIVMALDVVPVQDVEGFNSCIIAPLFWFNDWPRLFIFIEWWRRLGVNKILIHLDSISKETKQLLDYYVDEGVVVVRSMPRMQYTDKFDTNGKIHYSNSHLALFYCSVWSNTLYTSMNDIDELFYISKHRRRVELTRLDVQAGELSLKHAGIWLDKPLVPKPWNYEEFASLENLKTARAWKYWRMPKYFYRTRYVKVPWVHGVKSFFASKKTKTLSTDEAVYLHLRYNMYGGGNRTYLFPDFRLFSTDEEQERLRDTLTNIFGDSEPDCLLYEIREKSQACVKQISKAEGCTGTSGKICQKALEHEDDWFYGVASEDSQFTIL